jgi:hypothetical protein
MSSSNSSRAAGGGGGSGMQPNHYLTSNPATVRWHNIHTHDTATQAGAICRAVPQRLGQLAEQCIYVLNEQLRVPLACAQKSCQRSHTFVVSGHLHL